jgi:phospholipid transport system substrate-binding protein
MSRSRSSLGALTVLAVVAVILVPLAVRDALAGEPTDQLKRHIEQALSLLRNPQLASEGKAEERRAALRNAANEIFDFEETAKRALGRHWRARSPQERQEFVRLFTDLLEHSYLSKIEQYQGEKIVYAAETVDGDQATVRTRIQTPRGQELPVDYRMLREGDRWRVYDVTIEGVSLVGNYRTQFSKIIQTASYQELVEKLKARAFTAPATDRRG